MQWGEHKAVWCSSAKRAEPCCVAAAVPSLFALGSSRHCPGTAARLCPPIHRLRRGCTQPEEEYGTSLRSGSIFDRQEEIPAQAGLGELQQ